MELEMIAIEGLDEAILGTGIRTSKSEVLVYDGDVAEEILLHMGYGENSLPYFLESIDLDGLGDKAPMFIYLDNDQNPYDRTTDIGQPRLRLVH